MADRFWVGGTATWDGTAGTKWATTSGGAGGASVPTSSDNVYFDAASGASTVTFSTSNGVAVCNDFVTTGFTGTIGGGGGVINIYGSLLIGTATTVTTASSSLWYFMAASGSKTINTNGKQLYNVYIGPTSATTATWNLASSLTCANVFSIRLGTFNSLNYSLTFNSFQNGVPTNLVATWNCGTSVVTDLNDSTFTVGTGIVLNAGTATFVFAGNVSGVTVSSPTNFGTISTNSTPTVFSLYGPMTVGVLTVNRSTYTAFVLRVESLTITQALNCTGSTSNARVIFKSQYSAIPANITFASGAVANITNTDFLDIVVTGATVSGSTLGDYGGNSGITFSAGRNCYRVGTNTSWTDLTSWSATSGDAADATYYPLPQDTAIFDNATTGTAITLVTASQTGSSSISVYGLPNINLAARTTAYTVTFSSICNVYGSLTLGSSVTYTWSGAPVFCGGKTVVLTASGVTINSNITTGSPNVTLRLGSAITTGASNTFIINYGTFYTDNYALTCNMFEVVSDRPTRAYLGSSTITTTNQSMKTYNYVGRYTDYGVDVGTSTNIVTGASTLTLTPATKAYAVTFTAGTTNINIGGTNNGPATSVQQLTIAASTTTAYRKVYVYPYFKGFGSVEIGTLITTSTSPIYRVLFFGGQTGGSASEFGSFYQFPLYLNAANLTDSDFYNINVVTPSGGNITGTRLGDLGSNYGITFTSKTVYWNSAGNTTWGSASWATTSGGAASINNFPLPQDTAIFDTGSAPATVTFNQAYYVGSINTVGRSTALNLGGTSTPIVVGNVTLNANTALVNAFTFGSYAVDQTLTSGGASHEASIYISKFNSALKLGAAFTTSGYVFLNDATFNTMSYAVTSGAFYMGAGNNLYGYKQLILGSTVWTLTSPDGWTANGYRNSQDRGFIDPGSSTIIISYTGASASTTNVYLGGFSYNKFRIQSTNSNVLTTAFYVGDQLGSPITRAYIGTLEAASGFRHTIQFDSGSSPTYYIDTWTVSGQSGLPVTVSRSGANTTKLNITGTPQTVDYLNISNITCSDGATAFYVGANSTVTTCTDVIATAPPAATTRYWVGGTGTWDTTTTTNWSATSGGAGGASAPTSVDDVVFDAASSAAGYTVTISATIARCKNLTVSGPASGNVTLSGLGLTVTGNTTIASTGVTTSGFCLTAGGSGNTTLTSNSVPFISANGTNALRIIKGTGTLTLGSAFSIRSTLQVLWGGFDTSSYALTIGGTASSNTYGVLDANNKNKRSISFGSSAVSILSNGDSVLTNIAFGPDWPNTTGQLPYGNINYAQALTFNAGTSTVTVYNVDGTGYSKLNSWYSTFYNVVFAKAVIIGGVNTYNNLTLDGSLSDQSGGVYVISLGLYNTQTINGTLTRTATTTYATRHVFQGPVDSTPVVMSIANASLQDTYFRNIEVKGAASPVTGAVNVAGLGSTTGVTNSPARVYYRVGSNGNWTGNNWALTSNGTASFTYLPGAADVAIIDNNTGSGTITFTGQVGGVSPIIVGTINSSTRSTAGISINNSSQVWVVKDFINSNTSSITYSGSSTYWFLGTGTQTMSGGNINLGTNTVTVYKTSPVRSTFNLRTNLTLNTTSNHFTARAGNISTGSNTITASTLRIEDGAANTMPINGQQYFNSYAIIDWGNSVFRLGGATPFYQASAVCLFKMPNATVVLTYSGSTVYTPSQYTYGQAGQYSFTVGTLVRNVNANLGMNGSVDIGTLATTSLGTISSFVTVQPQDGNYRIKNLRIVGASNTANNPTLRFVGSGSGNLVSISFTGTTPMPLAYTSVNNINASSATPMYVLPNIGTIGAGSGWTVGTPSYSW